MKYSRGAAASGGATELLAACMVVVGAADASWAGLVAAKPASPAKGRTGNTLEDIDDKSRCWFVGERKERSFTGSHVNNSTSSSVVSK